MLDPRQRSAPVWTIRSVAVRSRDGPQRIAQVYRRLLAPPRCDGAGGAGCGPKPFRPGPRASAPPAGGGGGGRRRHRRASRAATPSPRGDDLMRVAAIYARVSTERQERQQTIDSQLAVLRRWAEAG